MVVRVWVVGVWVGAVVGVGWGWVGVLVGGQGGREAGAGVVLLVVGDLL